MQQHKCVEDYLNAVIPKNIADSKATELRAEMEGHIYDKAEFYMEIGYDEETAFNKAVTEMGEADGVKTEFEAIYKDSTLKGVLWFLGVCTVNFLFVGVGHGYFLLEHNYSFVSPSVLELFLSLCFLAILVSHTVKCCRNKLHKQLKGISYAFAFISACSIITSGIFVPVAYAVPLILCYVTSGTEPDFSLVFLINILLLFVYTLLCFLSLVNDYRYQKKTHRISVKTIAVILLVISIGFSYTYGLAYIKYEYPYLEKKWYRQNAPESEFLSNKTTEQLKIYNSIKLGDDVRKVKKLLKETGFANENAAYEADTSTKELDEMLAELFPEDENDQGIEKYITSRFFSYEIESYLSSNLVKNVGTNKYTAYYYDVKDSADDENTYDDIISCILISYDNEGKIDYKLYFPDVESDIPDTYYQNNTHGEATLKWFNSLKKGDSIDSALKFIRSTDSLIIEDKKRVDTGTKSVYKIYLQCLYPIETDFIDFILGNPPETIGHSFEIDIEAENGKIMSGVMDYYYDDDADRTIDGTAKIK
ncbi:MAG: permease prefix domain 1-containing protein [Acutalibacteraceae bacterium]|nr:permease prefix domain 1-containing protein [Acutalibacteraceae bacterium]